MTRSPDAAQSRGRLETPVVLLLFNRPVLTARVFEAIRQARPTRLFLIADGPRRTHPEDEAAVAAARGVVAHVDWNCEVVRDYYAENRGVGLRVSSGLDRVFDQVQEAVILEDDCLPDPTFFPFCAELLARYRDDERVMMVSGTNHLLKWKDQVQDFHFSLYGSIWGWATWRRAWKQYDYRVQSLSDPATQAHIAALLADPEQFAHRVMTCERVLSGAVDTWDYQWTWARLAHSGLAAVSAVNLVSNIGFGGAATHTTNPNLSQANLCRYPAPASLRAPEGMTADRSYDRKTFLRMCEKPDVDSIVNQGLALLEAGRIIHALVFFEQAHRAQPERVEALYYKALALTRLRRAGPAIDTLQDFLQHVPDHADALALLDSLTGR